MVKLLRLSRQLPTLQSDMTHPNIQYSTLWSPSQILDTFRLALTMSKAIFRILISNILHCEALPKFLSLDTFRPALSISGHTNTLRPKQYCTSYNIQYSILSSHSQLLGTFRLALSIAGYTNIHNVQSNIAHLNIQYSTLWSLSQILDIFRLLFPFFGHTNWPPPLCEVRKRPVAIFLYTRSPHSVSGKYFRAWCVSQRLDSYHSLYYTTTVHLGITTINQPLPRLQEHRPPRTLCQLSQASSILWIPLPLTKILGYKKIPDDSRYIKVWNHARVANCRKHYTSFS